MDGFVVGKKSILRSCEGGVEFGGVGCTQKKTTWIEDCLGNPWLQRKCGFGFRENLHCDDDERV